MPFSLLPALRTEALTDISAQTLTCRNIRLLMLDFDNTIVPYTTDEPKTAFLLWLETMKQSQLQLCVVSNSRNDRVVRFCQKHGIDCITHARKPFSKGIRACMERYGLNPEQCALVGDQIYTDVLGGNCAGVTTILVKAIDNHNFWLKLRHVAEMPFIYAARNRRVEK